jgi:hypothetical protein
VSALWRELLVVAAALLLAAGAVHGWGDRATLVPPPEAAVEEFAKKLVGKRYRPAYSHLSEELARSVPADSLRLLTEALERSLGSIEKVQGEPVHRSGEAAEASAKLTTTRGDTASLRFPLLREQGVWKISRLDPLLPAP